MFMSVLLSPDSLMGFWAFGDPPSSNQADCCKTSGDHSVKPAEVKERRLNVAVIVAERKLSTAGTKRTFKCFGKQCLDEEVCQLLILMGFANKMNKIK